VSGPYGQFCHQRPSRYLARVQPPERIEIDAKTRIVLTWSEGVVADLSAARLRAVCPCADCRTERDNRPRLHLTVLGPEPSIESAHLVGDYGLGISFGPDGHRTGIFTWDLLYSMGQSG
jgi:DUF971 family protein